MDLDPTQGQQDSAVWVGGLQGSGATGIDTHVERCRVRRQYVDTDQRRINTRPSASIPDGGSVASSFLSSAAASFAWIRWTSSDRISRAGRPSPLSGGAARFNRVSSASASAP